jgi:hypothetical protein
VRVCVCTQGCFADLTRVTVVTDKTFNQDTICLLYCARYRTLVRTFHACLSLFFIFARQALSSLVNLTIFFLKFLATRMVRRATLSRLPVVARKLRNPNRIELLAVVPSELLPAGTKLRKLLDRLGTRTDEAIRRFQHEEDPNAEAEPEDDGSEVTSASAATRSVDRGDLRQSSSGPEQEMVSVSAASPSAAIIEAQTPPAVGDVEPDDGAPARARTVNFSLDVAAAPAPAPARPPAKKRYRTRVSFSLGEMQPEALAKESVLVPLASWLSQPFLSIPALVRLRRSPVYQLLGSLVVLLPGGATVWALWAEYDQLWLFVVTAVVTLSLHTVELTRWDRGLFHALVGDAALVARPPISRALAPQLRQYEFYFISVSTVAYLCISSLLRVRRAHYRDEPAPTWLIATHCLVVRLLARMPLCPS